MERHTLRADGSTATIGPYGAQVLSWTVAGRERIFLSPQAVFAPGTAIRGGIPVIFPQFNARGPGPRHGFARNTAWEAVAPPQGGEGDAAVAAFALRDSAWSRALWNHPFDARLVVTLAARSLSVRLRVANPGSEPMAFTCALHTYLRVAGIGATRLHGLQGVAYEDAANGGAWAVQEAPALAFDGEVDRVYRDASGALVLADGESDLAIRQSGFRDTVVWNPGAALAARMGDLGPGGHAHFVCVEAACVHRPVELAPGEAWDGSQDLIV